jgi:hypothetical protein
MADLARIKLSEREERTVGAVVDRRRCCACGSPPGSGVAAWAKVGEEVEPAEH